MTSLWSLKILTLNTKMSGGIFGEGSLPKQDDLGSKKKIRQWLPLSFPTGASCRPRVVGVDGDGDRGVCWGSLNPAELQAVESGWIRHMAWALICWFQWCIWDSCWQTCGNGMAMVYNIFINQCVYYTYSGWKFNSFQPTFTYSLYCMLLFRLATYGSDKGSCTRKEWLT